MATPTLSPPPLENVVGDKEGKASTPWGRWLRQLWETVRGASDLAVSLGTVANTKGTQTFQSKSIDGASNTLTNIGIGSLSTTYFMVRNSADQSIPHNTETAVAFPVENLDNRSAFATDTFTCPSGQAGNYFFSASALINPAVAISVYRIFIRKNGATSYGADIQDGVAGSFKAVHATAVIDLAVGDTVRVYIIHTNGTSVAQNVLGDGSFTYFMGWRVA